MTREEVFAKLYELACPYQHMRMTECPHCAKDVESALRDFSSAVEPEKSDA